MFVQIQYLPHVKIRELRHSQNSGVAFCFSLFFNSFSAFFDCDRFEVGEKRARLKLDHFDVH